jgi:hypothetical protein
MQIDYDSEWMRPTVELMKCLEDFDKPIINEKLGSIDYVIDNEDGKKLIRAMVNENYSAAPIYTDTIRATIKELNEEKFDEAVILSKRITDAAYKIVIQEDNLDIITPDMKHPFSLIEILSSIERKTRDLCKIKCGKAPEMKDDCKGKKGRKYICDVRRLSDDASFHAQMKWIEVLTDDFNNICGIENEMNKISENN